MVAAQPSGGTETPAGDLVVAVNAVAGQLPVAPPIPIINGQPLAGTGPHVQPCFELVLQMLLKLLE